MSLLGLETGKIKQRITNFYTVTSIKFGYEDRVASNLKWKIFFSNFVAFSEYLNVFTAITR